MADHTESKIYEKLPLIYEHLMSKVNYSSWARYVYHLVKAGRGKSSKVLELGAGSCSFASNFNFYYRDLVATDFSKNMLCVHEANSLKKVCCDMTSLPFKSKFDIVYCTFDSVNYLTSKKKLLAMFKEVYSLLNSGGVFTFDASLENNSFRYEKEPERTGYYQGVHYSQKSIYNPATRIHNNSFVLTTDAGEVYTEVHKQKIYPFETYFDLLEKAGLMVTDCFDAFSFKNGSGQSDRVQFITNRINRNVEF